MPKARPQPLPTDPRAGGRAAFDPACDREGIPVGARSALWEVCRQLAEDAPPGPEVIERTLAEWAHWQLYLASRAGDAAAARSFERHWRAYIRSYLSGRMPADQADDAASQFFERVYRLVGEEFDWHCAFSVYLRKVVLNLSRTEATRRARRASREVSLDGEADGLHEILASPAPTPERLVLDRERAAAVRRALAGLAPVDGHILHRCLVEGEPGDSVAAALGIRRDALYQRVRRAKQRLKELLGRELALSDLGGRVVKRIDGP